MPLVLEWYCISEWVPLQSSDRQSTGAELWPPLDGPCTLQFASISSLCWTQDFTCSQRDGSKDNWLFFPLLAVRGGNDHPLSGSNKWDLNDSVCFITVFCQLRCLNYSWTCLFYMPTWLLNRRWRCLVMALRLIDPSYRICIHYL